MTDSAVPNPWHNPEHDDLWWAQQRWKDSYKKAARQVAQKSRNYPTPDEFEYDFLSTCDQETLDASRLSCEYMLGQIRRMLQDMYYFKYVSSASPTDENVLTIRMQAIASAREAYPKTLPKDRNSDLDVDEVPAAFVKPGDNLDQTIRDGLVAGTISLHETWMGSSELDEHLCPTSGWAHECARGRVCCLIRRLPYFECNSTTHSCESLYDQRNRLAHAYWNDPNRNRGSYRPADHWAVLCHILPQAEYALSEQVNLLDRLDRDFESGVLRRLVPESEAESDAEPEPVVELSEKEQERRINERFVGSLRSLLEDDYEESLYWKEGEMLEVVPLEKKEQDKEEGHYEEEYYDAEEEDDYGWTEEDYIKHEEWVRTHFDEEGNLLDDDGNRVVVEEEVEGNEAAPVDDWFVAEPAEGDFSKDSCPQEDSC